MHGNKIDKLSRRLSWTLNRSMTRNGSDTHLPTMDSTDSQFNIYPIPPQHARIPSLSIKKEHNDLNRRYISGCYRGGCTAISRRYAMGRNYNELASIGPLLQDNVCAEHAHIRSRRNFGSGPCTRRGLRQSNEQAHHPSAIHIIICAIRNMY